MNNSGDDMSSCAGGPALEPLSSWFPWEEQGQTQLVAPRQAACAGGGARGRAESFRDRYFGSCNSIPFVFPKLQIVFSTPHMFALYLSHRNMEFGCRS